jgi:hypothetical protein
MYMAGVPAVQSMHALSRGRFEHIFAGCGYLHETPPLSPVRVWRKENFCRHTCKHTTHPHLLLSIPEEKNHKYARDMEQALFCSGKAGTCSPACEVGTCFDVCFHDLASGDARTSLRHVYDIMYVERCHLSRFIKTAKKQIGRHTLLEHVSRRRMCQCKSGFAMQTLATL